MSTIRIAVLILFAACLTAQPSMAEDLQPRRVALGYIGSLSGEAASYGQAVLAGARLAVKELEAAGQPLDLVVEDDHTEARSTVSAFQKLTSVDHVAAVIGGSWWANSIVQPAEQKKVLLLSCETLYNKDVVEGATYFMLGGYLNEWVRAYEPLVAKKGWKSGAIIRFTSGFADTLAEEMQHIFSAPGRRFAGDLVFSRFDMDDAPQLVLQLKRLQPEVVYLDGQPGGLVNVLRRIQELQLDTAVFTHSALRDALEQKLIDRAGMQNVYYTDRETFNPDFSGKFRAAYGKEPVLNADLGYYAVRLAAEALRSPDPAAELKAHEHVLDGIAFTFDRHNVFTGMRYQVWSAGTGRPALP